MIYTFYSYKGGVGRSMALANIAEMLVARGLRVLAVDFDLEAPGLERFFDRGPGSFTGDQAVESRGIVDLLGSYKDLRALATSASVSTETGGGRQEGDGEATLAHRVARLPVEPLNSFCVPVYEDKKSGGSLRLIGAGRRDGQRFRQYAERVLSFDWEDFYRRWDGGAGCEGVWVGVEIAPSSFSLRV